MLAKLPGMGRVKRRVDEQQEPRGGPPAPDVSLVAPTG